MDAYLQDNILGSLKMSDTTVKMSAEQRARSVPDHVRKPDGSFTVTDLDWPQEPEFWAGGHALYSARTDYLRFQRMLLGDGSLEGTQILLAATVDEAFRNQIGDLDFPTIVTTHPELNLDVDLGPGLKWGLGLLHNIDGHRGMRAAGGGSWAGIFNSHFRIDRTNRLTAALYLQFVPFFDPKAASNRRIAKA